MYFMDRCKVIWVSLSLLAICFSSYASADSQSRNRLAVFSQLTEIMEKREFDNSQLYDSLPGINSQTSLRSASPTPFIIGGTAVGRNSFPEYTLVILTDGLGNITGLCGGTVIASNKVLTAAHCAQGRASSYFLIPGFYSFDDPITSADLITLSSVVDHPSYRNQALDFDIAVMTLTSTVTAAPAKVARGNDQLVGQLGTVIGTGLTATTPVPQAPDLLLSVETPIVSNELCSQAYLDLAGLDPITENMLCAGFTDSGEGSCSGDSGGALFVGDGSRRAISGVVSFGPETCEDQRATSVYARATAFSGFIRQQSPNTIFVNFSDSLALNPVYMMLLDD